MSACASLKQATWLVLLAAVLFAVASGTHAQWSVPEHLSSKLEQLNAEQAAFINSGAVLEFIPQRQIEHELATRDADSLKTLLDELLSLAAKMRYDPERDMGAIPLNLASKRFNQGTLPTPEPLRKLQRQPGPFSVHRYLVPKSGVPTFGGANVAIWPEDLVAGKVDVAIIGVPNDMGGGRRDAGEGPAAMRGLNTIAAADMQSLVAPLEVLHVVDYGDIRVDILSTERTATHVAAMVAETAATGAIPMLVGGDTSMLYPGVKGIAENHGNGSFGLLHFSAHPDVDRLGDHLLSDKQALFLLLQEGLVNGHETIQVGLRGPAVNAATLEWLRSQKVRYHTMAKIQQEGFDATLKKVLAEVNRGPERYFVSIDVSVIEPAEMVAAGRIAPHGLRIQEAARAIRQVCAGKEIVGFEITDMAPRLDFTRLSVVNANALLNACLVGIAVRRAGLEPDYIHPLVRGHGQR